MSRTLKPSRDDTSRVACVVLVGISWAMVVANVVINVRNGQRLSIDDYGWALNTLVIGLLSIAPTAALGFAGYRWRRGSRLLATLALIGAAPLVVLNLWSANEYLGDQMLGRYERAASEQSVAEQTNDEVLRSKREAEEKLWKAWNATKDPSERASIMREISKVRAETPNLKATIGAGTVGARSHWLSSRLGWTKETIEGITPMAVPTLMQMVELLFSFLGFSAWPHKQVHDDASMFHDVPNGTSLEFTLDDARRDIVHLRVTGRLDEMKLSKAAFAKRWGVPKTTAWNWLQRLQVDGFIDSALAGKGNAHAVRARVNGS